MKKYLVPILFLISALSFNGFAQGAYDALRFSQQYYSGTARSLSMGNAMTSIGGDLGALSYNPAASGVYRYSEFIVTPALVSSIDHSEYLGYRTKENKTRFTISNIGYVGNFSTGRTRGLLNLNLAITANQTNNFTSRNSASGVEAKTSWMASIAGNMPSNISGNSLGMPDTNPNYPFFNTNTSWKSILGWNTFMIDTVGGPQNFIAATENIDPLNGEVYVGGDLNQKYYNTTSGYSEDIVINFSGNVSDKLFFGLNVSFQNIWYNNYMEYSESAVNPSKFQTGFVDFKYIRSLTTTGYGINLKAGVIYRPVAGLSIGTSISTPTWMFLTDQWTEDMNSTFEKAKYSVNSPIGTYRYRINSPFKWNVGVGYTIGKVAVISADYEMTNYSNILMLDSYGNQNEFKDANLLIKNRFKTSNNVRVGAEFRISPLFSIRSGYNYYDSAERGFKGEKHLASLGLGYRSKGGFFADIAYQQQCNYTTEYYTLYEEYAGLGVPVMKSSYMKWMLLASFGVRF